MKKHPIQNEDQSQVSLGDFGISVPQIESLPMLPSAAKGTAASLKIRYKDFGDLTLADFEVFSRLPEIVWVISFFTLVFTMSWLKQRLAAYGAQKRIVG